MDIKTNKGVVGPATLIVIGLFLVCGIAYKKVFEPGRNQKVAAKIALATLDADAKVKQAVIETTIILQAAKATVSAHEAEITNRDKIDKNAADFNAQGKAVLEADPFPSPYTLIAIGLCDSVEASLGVVYTQHQRLEFVKRVKPLLQKNAELEKELAEKKAEAVLLSAGMDAERAHSKALDAHLIDVNQTLKETITSASKQAELAAKRGAQNNEWAKGHVTLLGRIKALGVLSGVLALLLVLIWVMLRRSGSAVLDATALALEMKRAITHGVTDIDKHVESWWQNDVRARKAFDENVNKLRQ